MSGGGTFSRGHLHKILTNPIYIGQGLAVLPMGIKANQPHTGIGADGGLAQPLQEPEK